MGKIFITALIASLLTFSVTLFLKIGEKDIERMGVSVSQSRSVTKYGFVIDIENQSDVLEKTIIVLDFPKDITIDDISASFKSRTENKFHHEQNGSQYKFYGKDESIELATDPIVIMGTSKFSYSEPRVIVRDGEKIMLDTSRRGFFGWIVLLVLILSALIILCFIGYLGKRFSDNIRGKRRSAKDEGGYYKYLLDKVEFEHFLIEMCRINNKYARYKFDKLYKPVAQEVYESFEVSKMGFGDLDGFWRRIVVELFTDVANGLWLEGNISNAITKRAYRVIEKGLTEDD